MTSQQLKPTFWLTALAAAVVLLSTSVVLPARASRRVSPASAAATSHVPEQVSRTLPWQRYRCRRLCFDKNLDTAAASAADVEQCLTRCADDVNNVNAELPSKPSSLASEVALHQQQQQELDVVADANAPNHGLSVNGQRSAARKTKTRVRAVRRAVRSIIPNQGDETSMSAAAAEFQTWSSSTPSAINISRTKGSSGGSGVERTSTPRLEGLVRQAAGAKGGLEAFVWWDWSSSSGAGGGDVGGGYEFNVHFARMTCNVYDDLPRCEDPDDYKHSAIWSPSTKANCTLPGLRYNSKYFVQIDYNSQTSPRLYLTTPRCPKPADKKFLRCQLPVSEPPVKGDTPPNRGEIRQMTTTPLSVDNSLYLNVTCLTYSTMLGTVSVLVTWQRPDAPGSGTEWNSTVSYSYMTEHGVHPNLKLTSLNAIQLELQAKTVYEILVMSTGMGGSEVMYQPKIVNTTEQWASVCLSGASAPLTARQLPHSTDYSTVIVFVSLLAVAVVVVLVAIFAVCTRVMNGCPKTVISTVTRRQSNLEDKTTRSLTKSNSYKSSPSGSPCLRKDEQIALQLKDVWEIDAHEVILGVELGQGAFGLVMTGFYQGTQVAIKVLKSDAPPSHRDELLREIELMKQIGHHTNIVALVGACTICDPIALIMEYMPYGNLQSFLQKCRHDGSVVRGVETVFQYCPLDQLTGVGETKWTLTSADMISFARQIAMAMEYLSDRKYVHRDLAARNVLVGTDKVVKLCDFGLARLVYTGDSYCKLTNGRLPLKWMALESIRDRVFTVQSDVWSFGVLLWEIATLGASPYVNIALVDLYRLLSTGYRLEQPTNCSSELYDIMSQCWCENPAHRPTFNSIRQQLDDMLSHHRNYLDLDNLGLHRSSSVPGESSGNAGVLDSSEDEADQDYDVYSPASGLLPPGAIRQSALGAVVAGPSRVDDYQMVRSCVPVCSASGPLTAAVNQTSSTLSSSSLVTSEPDNLSTSKHTERDHHPG